MKNFIELYHLEKRKILLPSIADLGPFDLSTDQALIDLSTKVERAEPQAVLELLIELNRINNRLMVWIAKPSEHYICKLLSEIVVDVEVREGHYKLLITCLVDAFRHGQDFSKGTFLITAYSGKTAIGFRDVEVRLDNRVSFGHHGPLTNPMFDLFMPAAAFYLNQDGAVATHEPPSDLHSRQLRWAAGTDSLYVVEEHRGKGLGRYLFLLGLALSAQMGAGHHFIQHDETRRAGRGSFYAQFLAAKEPVPYQQWLFPLSSTARSDQFSIVLPSEEG